MRRPLFGRWGPFVVAGLCGWELVALVCGLPTVSQVVRRRKWVGVLLLAGLVQHWYLESVSPPPNPPR